MFPVLQLSRAVMGSWSELPFDVLEEIAEKLRHNDLTHFGAVCKSWRSVYLKNILRLPKDLPLNLCHPRPFGTPILLLSCKLNSNSRNYVSLHDETVNRQLFLPEAANKWICGSGWGWLILVDFRGIEVCLYNPLTRSKIQLPSLDSFPELTGAYGWVDQTPRDCFRLINRAIISSDPTSNPNDCVVMAIVGFIHQLFFCKLGDNRWTKAVGSPCAIQDVIYYEDKFYAITQDGLMVSYDGKNPNTESQVVAFGPELQSLFIRCLAISEGNLLQLFRYYSYPDEDLDIHIDDNDNDEYEDEYTSIKTETIKFDLFKLVKRNTPQHILHVSEDFEGSTECTHKWTELDNLNEHSLFLGYNSSLSIPKRLLPNFKGNRIYFTDDHYMKHVCNLLVPKVPIKVYHDIGIFDIDDKSVIKYHSNDPNDLMPSVWITPNPW
jgi:Protein of unknown function (DUF295)/F-box domain